MERPRPPRPDRGFTLIEVLIALAIFALAALYLAAAYLNIQNSYAAVSRGLGEDSDVAFSRNELLQITDLATAEAGVEYDTPDVPGDPSRHVKWTADIEPTNTPDVFTVTMTVVVAPSGGTSQTTVDTFTVLRPTWSDPFARPFGCFSFADISKMRALLAAPADTTTMLPRYDSRLLPRRIKTSVTSRPEALVLSWITSALVKSVTLEWVRAGRTAITSASALACTKHG